MTETRRKTILRMRQLRARTATITAISMQVLGCDPMNAPAREPMVTTDAGADTVDASPSTNAPDAGR